MVYQIPPQLPIVGFVFVVLISLAAYGGIQYHRLGHRPELLAFVSLMFGLSLTTLGNLFVDAATTVELKLLGYNFVNTVLVLFSAYSLLWFALAYSDNTDWVNRWTVGIAVGTIAVTSSAGVLSPEYMYEVNGLVSNGPVTILGVTFKEWVTLDRSLKLPFRLLQVYAYTVIFVSVVILVRYVLRNQSELYLGEAVWLIIGIGAPPVANSLLLVGIVPAELNVTDASFGITGVAFAIAIFRYEMLQVAPVGRRQLVEQQNAPVVMLNEESRVVDCNPSARDLFNVPDDWWGMAAEEFFAKFPDQFQRFADEPSVETEITMRDASSIRHFDLDISPIQNERKTARGRLIVLREITEQKVREQRLQRQNERLEQFASVVSHDLRNPLHVVQGRLELAKDDCGSEHLNVAAKSLNRSFELIDDLLVLARAGQDVSDREPITLSSFVDTCWGSVETSEAAIRVDAEMTILADRSRFRQLLENLFRNAVEHGGEKVTVRVGSLPDGFFVADDGSGIPEETREEVFDHGYSEYEDGTGFGLSIVEQIVEAHDWETRVTEASNGGARFEITGVTLADE
ncbi:histidine kinase N-terminal 7TM domain-containing protein [Halapricum hydrolyticum]|uniref:histidine kinase n=1 Tax=Halapricum hydrolyticum TaxID=2979991 RepID=A0AAE3LGH9_9EURY|nr:histidine kinase N-terminal 7TM domain-containing protein [Halapricum hydrolyticum]MCU4716771.1 ATP-binding protein [Halapricum hydrolyticum]MCU4725624.1 ATP-binding protein [Halapricum hydrolyticum]